METILIVDDVQTNREILGKIVTAAGHRPEFACDGDEAILRAKELRPALIFLDVVMPAMNGFQACRRLKQDTETSKIPVVLVTSKTADSDKFWGQKQGADMHIGKPFGEGEIQDVIRRYVRR
jgi:twitching motility two-component system response regulator PilH